MYRTGLIQSHHIVGSIEVSDRICGGIDRREMWQGELGHLLLLLLEILGVVHLFPSVGKFLTPVWWLRHDDLGLVRDL